MKEKKLVHVERIDVRWGDMDAMGHVNNTVYFRYMEQARIGWFESLLPRGEAWRTVSIVIVNASCNFRKPINYPGTVEVKVFAGEPGGSNVGTFYEPRPNEKPEGGCATQGGVVGRGKQKPLRIPDEIR